LVRSIVRTAMFSGCLLLVMTELGAATGATPRSVTLKWDSPKQDSSVVSFNIYRTDASKRDGIINCAAKYKKIAVVKMPTTSYRDVNVKSHHSYCYSVSSVSAGGEGSEARQIKVTVP
jgi:fibronectin type 3 domain-containing protein